MNQADHKNQLAIPHVGSIVKLFCRIAIPNDFDQNRLPGIQVQRKAIRIKAEEVSHVKS